jgi:Tol biopolymer transport system component
MSRLPVALLAVWALTLMPVDTLARGASLADIEPATGTLLAPVARQAGWLSLEAPRPRLLTSYLAPSFVADLDVAPTGWAALSVQSMFPGQDAFGNDLVALDLHSGVSTPLLTRTDAGESLGAPVWSPDGAWLLFQREDLSRPPMSYAYQAQVRYPARVEAVSADGAGRWEVVEDALQPAVAPSGSQLAYLRSSSQGTALLVRSVVPTSPPDEREVIPAGRFPDVAHPRFSPQGDRIAFVVAVVAAPIGGRDPLDGWFGPSVALAHGLPWDLWLVDLDGSAPRRLAELGADDPSVSWSPDGGQLFVYGGTGSFIVDALTGETRALPYLAGYGTTAWVPVS